MLSDEQIERYSRQIILPQVGGKGQERLLRARVLVRANGPLHTAVHYLAAAGVGTLGVFADSRDTLLTALAGSRKQAASFHVLPCLNPDCSIVLHSAEDTKSPHQLVQAYDCVLSDSASLHDVCYATRRPFCMLHCLMKKRDSWYVGATNSIRLAYVASRRQSLDQ
jgi:adenylyltransferase/sulfurtransferase